MRGIKRYVIITVIALAALANKNERHERPTVQAPAPVEWVTVESPIAEINIPEVTAEEVTQTVDALVEAAPEIKHIEYPEELASVTAVLVEEPEHVKTIEIPGVETLDLGVTPVEEPEYVEPVAYVSDALVYIEVEENQQSLYERTMACLQHCPENLKKHYFGNGYAVNIVDKSVTDEKGCIGYIEITEGGASEIFVSAYGYCIEAALLHEFGHYLDHICGNPSDSEYFAELMLTEGVAAGFDTYHTTNTGEYFAEVFQELVYNPNGTTINNCPQSAAFVKMCVDQI